jgi:RNA polymerase sigma factor (sigma-70 family)
MRWRQRTRRSPGSAGRVVEQIGVLPPVVAALLAAVDPGAKDAAWGPFAEVYTPLLLHTAYRFGHTYDGAMDRYSYLLEHLYHNDFRRLRAFAATGPGRFSTWLVVVARRALLDYHRQRYGRSRPTSEEDRAQTRASSTMRRNLAELVGEDVLLAVIGDGSTLDPEAATYAAERTEAVHIAVSSLEPGDQLLLRLRFAKELPAREIADIMGLPSQFHVYRRIRAVLATLGRLIPQEYAEAI